MNVNNYSDRYVLLSVFSVQDNSCGLCVYDLEHSREIYLYLISDKLSPSHYNQLRGLLIKENLIFAVTHVSVHELRNINSSFDLNLNVENSITKPEWVLGPDQQGNLHAISESSRGNSFCVSFNTQCALDYFDFNGNFLNRRYLWDIIPDFFTVPKNINFKHDYRFGVVRHMFNDADLGLVLTVAFHNNSKCGALITESGKVLLRVPYNLHGSLVHNNSIFLSDIDAGLVYEYAWPIHRDAQVLRVFRPMFNECLWPGSVQKVRGMAILGDRLICGVFHPAKVSSHQIPPRLVEFDLLSGDQVGEHFLPSFKGLSSSQAYSVIPAPDWITRVVSGWDDPKYFFGENQIFPEYLFSKPFAQPISSVVQDVKESVCKDVLHTSSDEISILESVSNVINVHPDLSITECPDLAIDHSVQLPVCIELENVGLCFVRKASSLFGFNKQLRRSRSFWALRHVSFVMREGESVGVIGRNGSGKSSLSLLCAGVYKPDEGKITVHGRVQLLALGVGFKPELTGRDNVFVSASLLGLSRKNIKRLFPEIEAFADLGDFMDEPVRTYSSGMKSKLGFAVATAVEPEILILDEAMSVGDKSFKDKAMARMREMRQKAKSVLIVSHNPGEIKKLCTRVLWMEHGRLMMDGDSNKVVHAYENFCKNPEKWLLKNSERLLESN